ncbi:YlbF family regulator [Oscillospiraceae bacterium MB08-C2-2]|nr:YlbF family regulator [Oscillospiraceae bacterium MB08-C2-2]
MDIIQMAKELGKAIQADEQYIAMRLAQEKSDGDEVLQNMIKSFNLKRVELNQLVQKPDREQAAVTALDAEVKSLYNTIMSNANMMVFSATRKDMESTMDYINQILSGSVNGEDPDSIEPQEAGGCGGSCSGCSGCN